MTRFLSYTLMQICNSSWKIRWLQNSTVIFISFLQKLSIFNFCPFSIFVHYFNFVHFFFFSILSISSIFWFCPFFQFSQLKFLQTSRIFSAKIQIFRIWTFLTKKGILYQCAFVNKYPKLSDDILHAWFIRLCICTYFWYFSDFQTKYLSLC